MSVLLIPCAWAGIFVVSSVSVGVPPGVATSDRSAFLRAVDELLPQVGQVEVAASAAP